MDERFLGRIEEFMRNIEKTLVDNKQEHVEIKEDIKDLIGFKWRIIGVATTLSTILSLAVTLLSKHLGSK